MRSLSLSSNVYIFQSKPIPESVEPSLTWSKYLSVIRFRESLAEVFM